MPAAPMKRGSNAALTREIPNLRGVVLGVALSSAEPVLNDNLVVATLLCDDDHKVLSDEHMVFFNQLTEPDMTVTQLAAAADVDIERVPAEVHRIVVVAYLNEGMGHRRTLGQLRDARIRVLNLAGGVELVRSENLAPALTGETGLVLGELYRHEGGWKFKVVGQGYPNGVVGIAADHGIGL